MTIAATITLFATTAIPMPISDDPRYSGWRVYRYGPDCVTSLLFSRWPAAQRRIDSPTIAITAPITSDRGEGVARYSTIAAKTNPRNTRHRASSRVIVLAAFRWPPRPHQA